MKRGDVWWVQFGGTGGEIRKSRPAVIVSNNAANKYMNRVQVIPMSTNVERVYPNEAIVLVRGKKHKAMADQIATASEERLANRVGRLSEADMRSVDEAIRVQLALGS